MWCQSLMGSCHLAPRRRLPPPSALQQPTHTRSPALHPEHTNTAWKSTLGRQLTGSMLLCAVPDTDGGYVPVKWSFSPLWQGAVTNPGPSQHTDKLRNPSWHTSPRPPAGEQITRVYIHIHLQWGGSNEPFNIFILVQGQFLLSHKGLQLISVRCRESWGGCRDGGVLKVVKIFV